MPAPFSPLTSQRLRPSATTTTLTGGHYAAPVSVCLCLRRRRQDAWADDEDCPSLRYHGLPSKLGAVRFSGFRSAE